MATRFLHILCFSLCLFSIAFGGIEDSYKKCLHKRNYHSMGVIDYVYMISLKGDKKRFVSQKKQFEKYHVIPYRFTGHDPSKASYKLLETCGVTKLNASYPYEVLSLSRMGRSLILEPSKMSRMGSVYFNIVMNTTKICRSLDFLSVIYDAYKSDYKKVWVLEDTVDIETDPNILNGYCIQLDKIDSNWDILYTDPDCINQETYEGFFYLSRPGIEFQEPAFYFDRSFPTSEYAIWHTGLHQGAYSFIVSRNGMKKILSYYHKNKLFMPFESEVLMIPKLNCYSLHDITVVTDYSRQQGQSVHLN